MGLPDIPDGFFVPSRDEVIARHKRDQALLNPEVDVTSGQPDMDARLDSDLVLPVYNDAILIAEGINENEATGPRLDRVGDRVGVRRGQPRGSSGYVSVETSTGGGQMTVGVQLQNKATKLRYEFAETKRLQNGQSVRIRARDTGPNTDVPAGAILTIIDPPPGFGQQVTVLPQSDGRGLTGGANVESDEPYRGRIRNAKQNPPAGDNDAELWRVLQSTPEVAVEQPFTYPAFYGPGSAAFTITVLPPSLGASRIPAASQMQAVFEWISAQMPGDHGYVPLVPTSQALTLAFAITWAIGGWADTKPWPATYASGVTIASSTGPLNFVVQGGSVAPVTGNSLAVWDNAGKAFRRKRIASVSGAGPWTITCTSDNGASDTSYQPVVGQLVAPWSDSLAAVPTPVLTYLATLGPGETATAPGTFAEGRRKLRSPVPPKEWPYTTSAKVTVDIAALPEVADVSVKTGVGVTLSPSVPPRLLELSDLAFFPG